MKGDNRRVKIFAIVGAVLLVAILAFKMMGSGSGSAAPPPTPAASAAGSAAVAAPASHTTTQSTLPVSGAPRDPFSP